MRDYDPYTGRWTARDPAIFGGIDSNLYRYAAGDPINFVDRSGHAATFLPFGWNFDRAWEYLGDASGAWSDFRENYQDMVHANTIGADKYFHCKANCQAARRGAGGVDMSELVSDVREWTDEYIKGDARSFCNQDRRANNHGRNAGLNGDDACEDACSDLRPNGLNWWY